MNVIRIYVLVHQTFPDGVSTLKGETLDDTDLHITTINTLYMQTCDKLKATTEMFLLY